MKRFPHNKFSFPRDLLEILDRLKEHGFTCYVVGGAVRNLLLSQSISDWDLATDATPEQLLQIFQRIIPTGIRHGTVTLPSGTGQYEVTTFRTDGDYASQHRLRRSCVTRKIEEDLRHRDFTINAMAYDPITHTVIDPFGGWSDLKKRIIRGVEDPLERFMEDGLRPYRAIRFSVTLNCRIESKTLKAIPMSLEKTKTTSWERVRDEILKILRGENPSNAFEVMRKTGLLAISIPELLEGYRKRHDPSGDIYHHLLTTVDMAPPRPLLRMACLLHDIGKARARRRLKNGTVFHGHEKIGTLMADAVTKRLRLSNYQRKYIHILVENHGRPLNERHRDSELRRFLSEINTHFLDDLFLLSIANRRASGASPSELHRLNHLRRRTKEILRTKPPLTLAQLAIKGGTVKKILGIKQGVKVGRILNELLDIVLDDPAKNNPKDLTALVKKIGHR
jgi:putative nucleotidyltransferase with HDIG domain